MESIKLLAVFIVILLALRRHLPVGLVLFGAGLLLALLSGLSLSSLFAGYIQLAQSKSFLSLTAVVILITLLGSLLKELRYLDSLSAAVTQLPGGRRTAVATLPPLIGLMPMPGGSLLSAPLVDNVLRDGNYAPDFKMVANYWFRHLAEFFWPIYPGIILTEAITGMPMLSVSMMQFPLSLAMIAIGIIFIILKIKNDQNGEKNIRASLWGIVRNIWPIGMAIAIFGFFGLDLSIAIGIALAVLIIFTRPSPSILSKSFRESFTFNLIFLIFGVLSFQMVIEQTDAIAFMPALTARYNFPEELVVFLVCFTVGLLTGMVSAYVGLGYSLLAGLLYQPQLQPGLI